MASNGTRWSGWTGQNVFTYDDLKPLAEQTGMERDVLANSRDSFLKQKESEWRDIVGIDNFEDTSERLYRNADFRAYVQDGTRPQQQPTAAQQWNAPPMATQVQQQAATAAPVNQQRNSALWDELWNRASQSTAINKNDPHIRAQADAYSANEQRASKEFLADVAERSGPHANLRGEARMAAERVGQRTGGFEAELMGRELTAIRQQKAQALESLRGMLSTDEEAQLRRELAALDSELARMGFGLQERAQNLQNSQFEQRLGLDAEDRSTYWDSVRRGIL